jgi:nucleotide-binding universal stress UspA family protein
VRDNSRITPRILIGTDFTSESRRAFYHALALAVAHQARLTLLHIGPESRKEVPWDRYPGIRETLIGWGRLSPDSEREEVQDRLGLNVKKMAMRDEDPHNGMVDYLRKHPTDLLIMATEARRGLQRLRRASVAEGVAYASHCHALLLPHDADDLIDRDTGKRRMNKALFVYDHEPDPLAALNWLHNWLPPFSEGDIEAHLLHVGFEEEAPEVVPPNTPGVTWVKRTQEGPELETILAYVDDFQPDLLIMGNQRGGRGIAGRIRGSLNEQVLRRAGKPMLLMPVL